MSTISSIGSAVSSAVSKVTEKATESKSTSSNASTKSYTSDAVSVSTSSTESTSESLDTKLNNIEKEKEAEFKDKNKAVDRQAIGEATDEFMLSEEAQEEMIEINGTDGNDKIKASINKENGNIIININGEEQEYTQEEAANGFKFDLGDGNDKLDISALCNNFIIDAGEGDNNLKLSQGRNIVTAGDGNNTITSKNAHRNNITTGNGDNKINIKGDIDTITTGSGNDKIALKGTDSKVNSGDGNDTIISLGERDKIYAGDGDDYIISINGNASIYGENGNDKVRSFGNNNYIEGGAGDDDLWVRNGNNIIYGLDGNDKIKAGNGDNYIDGGKGNDDITVGKGSNIIFGGLDNDTINAQKSSGKIFDDQEGTINASSNMEVNKYDSSANASLGSSVSIDGTDDFKMRVESDIEALRATQCGQKLLSEYDNSGHTVNIIEINEQNGYETVASHTMSDYNRQFITPEGERGEGADAQIKYNPSFRNFNKGFLPLDVLFHEGVHAYNTTTGTMQPGEQVQENGNNANKLERQCVGLSIEDGIEVTHPDGTVSAGNPEQLTENGIRNELGIPRREIY